MIGYQEDTHISINGDMPPEIYHNDTSMTGADQKDDVIYMQSSFFLLPEAFDNDEI